MDRNGKEGEDKGRGGVGMVGGKKGKGKGGESERKRKEMRRKGQNEVFKMG